MVKVVRDHLGWAVRWPKDIHKQDDRWHFQFSFTRDGARKAREKIIGEVMQQLLQEEQ